MIARSDEVAHGKPEPDVFLEAARKLGVDAADCVAFEDAPMGVVAAARAGMTAVAVTTSYPAEILAATDPPAALVVVALRRAARRPRQLAALRHGPGLGPSERWRGGRVVPLCVDAMDAARAPPQGVTRGCDFPSSRYASYFTPSFSRTVCGAPSHTVGHVALVAEVLDADLARPEAGGDQVAQAAEEADAVAEARVGLGRIGDVVEDLPALRRRSPATNVLSKRSSTRCRATPGRRASATCRSFWTSTM